MRRTVTWALGLAACVSWIDPAAAQQGAGKAAAPKAAPPTAKPAATTKAAPAARPDPKRMAEVLQSWERQSQNTRTMYAKFERTDVATDWGTTTLYDGDAFLQSPNLAYLNFNKYDETTKAYTFNERIVCTPDRVYQFLAETKQVQIYDLAKDQRQRAMEEGPLPFLFNMKAEDARNRYEMTLLGENEKQCLIRIKPLQKLDREAFSMAYVTLDTEHGTPYKIRLMDASNDKNYKEFKFKDVRRNVEIKLDYFQGLKQAREVASKGWSIVEHPAEGPPAQSAAAAPRPGEGTVLAPRADRRGAMPPRR